MFQSVLLAFQRAVESREASAVSRESHGDAAVAGEAGRRSVFAQQAAFLLTLQVRVCVCACVCVCVLKEAMVVLTLQVKCLL